MTCRFQRPVYYCLAAEHRGDPTENCPEHKSPRAEQKKPDSKEEVTGSRAREARSGPHTRTHFIGRWSPTHDHPIPSSSLSRIQQKNPFCV